MRKGPPVIRMGLLLLLLLGSLTLVVWRQSRALETLRALESVRAERVLVEARRAGLVRQTEQLESRTRVSTEAQDRLGMRVPSGDELVILPLRSAPRSGALAAAPGGRGEAF